MVAGQTVNLLSFGSGGSTPSTPTICLNKLAGNREGNLTHQEGNKLVYGEPADREFEPHFKLQLNIPH